MTQPLEVERYLASQGINVGTSGNRNSVDVEQITREVEEARNSGSGTAITPTGQMYSATNRELTDAMARNPEIANAVQVLKEAKISY